MKRESVNNITEGCADSIFRMGKRRGRNSAQKMGMNSGNLYEKDHFDAGEKLPAPTFSCFREASVAITTWEGYSLPPRPKRASAPRKFRLL